MKTKKIIVIALTIVTSIIFMGTVCISATPQSWEQIKANAMPQVYLTNEFDTPYLQPLATLGWEDGIHISPDGLNLYCTYIPADFFSFFINGDTVDNLEDYTRGPTFGMDLETNPTYEDYKWIHSDILYAHRNSTSDSFTTWQLSDMARPIFSEGAPAPLFSENGTVEKMIFTSNDTSGNNNNIFEINNTTANPSGIGSAIPSPISSTYNEDNPHMVRINASTLVLFFDENGSGRPGNKGGIDIWYSTSTNNGSTWSAPVSVSINTSSDEHQPHLWKDSNNIWWLYYTSVNPANGKMAIYRQRQQTADNWTDWDNETLVVDSGTAAGIGECTLTQNGDISCVVTYKNSQGDHYDSYDADPWFIKSTAPTPTPTSVVTDNSSTASSQTDDSGNPTAIIIVIVAVIILAATTTIIIVKRKKK